MSSLIIISTTFEKKEDGLKVAERFLDERLVACAQLSAPVTSCYHWQGRVTTATEYILSLKTLSVLYEKVEKRLGEVHPYEVPEIVCSDITRVSSEYLAWVESEVSI
ncbi:MAG: divalent-cation tolerance protein CutA [Deltaproteobacteria bacterium]|nr:divalent-cation tolerance protein CutA [Deltaproteobacteria bacterium]MBW2660003.1 divalent-cation tolerance protein CutA [Deltaproteobacteria bacterium]